MSIQEKLDAIWRHLTSESPVISIPPSFNTLQPAFIDNVNQVNPNGAGTALRASTTKIKIQLQGPAYLVKLDMPKTLGLATPVYLNALRIGQNIIYPSGSNWLRIDNADFPLISNLATVTKSPNGKVDLGLHIPNNVTYIEAEIENQDAAQDCTWQVYGWSMTQS